LSADGICIHVFIKISTIGFEDSIQLVLDSNEILENPFFGKQHYFDETGAKKGAHIMCMTLVMLIND
jgi:hypothetical protein